WIQDSFVVTVNWGEGPAVQYPFGAGTKSYTLTHQYLDDNPTTTATDTYQVTVTVGDKDGGGGANFTSVNGNNAAPVVTCLIQRDETGATIGTDASFVLTGLNVELQSAFTDVGILDTLQGVVNWGDGSSAPGNLTESAGSGTLRANHSWSKPGNTTVKVTVTDDDTGAGTREKTIAVLDPAGAVCALAQQAATLLNDPLSPQVRKAVTQLLGQIQGNIGGQAFNGACDMFAKGNNVAGAVKLTQAVQTIEDLISGGSLTAAQQAVLRQVETGLILSAKSTYLLLVQTAGSSQADLRKLADAAALAQLADTAMASGSRLAAIGYWTQAIRLLAP